MTVRRDGEETRRRILESAVDVFAEKGFRNATHVEICKRCGVNSAAINYHFRSKERLYVESFKSAMRRIAEAHPLDGGIPEKASPELRFRGLVRSLVARGADPDNKIFPILHKEMASPTGLLCDIISTSMSEIKDDVSKIVGKLLGPGADDEKLSFCQESAIALCFHPIMNRRRAIEQKEGLPLGSIVDLKLDVDALSREVADFSLAGIRAMKKAGKAE